MKRKIIEIYVKFTKIKKFFEYKNYELKQKEKYKGLKSDLFRPLEKDLIKPKKEDGESENESLSPKKNL